MIKYFQGIEDWSADPNTPLFFCAGDAANPVIMLEHYVTTYGDRKPIMIAESGASHTIRTLKDRDETKWAKQKLEMLYKYVPMIYPQVKLIVHFDRIMPAEHSDYSLWQNKELLSFYQKLTKDGVFIHGSDEKAKYTYKKCEDTFTADGTTLNLASYAYSFGRDDIELVYYFAGKKVGTYDEAGYNVRIDLKKYRPGEHTLTVKAVSDGNVFMTREYTIVVE